MPVPAPLAPLPRDPPADGRRALGLAPGIALAVLSALPAASLALAIISRLAAWPLAGWALALALNYAWVRVGMGFMRVRRAPPNQRVIHQHAVHASFLAALMLLDLALLGGDQGGPLAPPPAAWSSALAALLAGGPLGAAARRLALARLALAEAVLCGLMAGKVAGGSYAKGVLHAMAMLAVAAIWALLALPGALG